MNRKRMHLRMSYLTIQIERLRQVTVARTDADDGLVAVEIRSDSLLVHHFVVEIIERFFHLERE